MGIDQDEFVQYLEDECRIRTVLRFWPIHLGGIMRMAGSSKWGMPGL